MAPEIGKVHRASFHHKQQQGKLHGFHVDRHLSGNGCKGQFCHGAWPLPANIWNRVGQGIILNMTINRKGPSESFVAVNKARFGKLVDPKLDEL